MNYLIKSFLICRSREQGFAIPIVIGLGLIMILIGMVSIVKSNEEDLTAIGQRGTQRALTAGEAGVAYYRDLINKNKAIAVYNSSGTVSWANNTGIPNLDFYVKPSPNNCFTASDGFGATNVTNAAGAAWRDVDSNLGQYKLINYEYIAADKIGRLVVEGRDRNSSNEASVTRLRVEFPIQPGVPRPPGVSQDVITENLNNLAPALWLGSDLMTLNGTKNNLNVVNGNILVSSLNCQLSTGTKAIAAVLPNIVAEPQTLPSIPLAVGGVNNITNSSVLENVDLPRSGDNWAIQSVREQTKNVYQYSIPNGLSLTNKNILINISPTNRTKDKIIFYVQNNITFDGNVDVNWNADYKSEHLEIYSNDPITIRFQGSGNIRLKAFIHAPNATVEVTGTPTVEITGAVWVKEWQNTTNQTVTITPDASYYGYTSVRRSLDNNALVIQPIIYPPSKWETVEAE
ncbi:hypothetical protein STA3757_26120 [Stanieria sp. NIES-3757]|nr:hypothetical protein STA3757_26120 [Stanieria sp. NIES-3757]